jgi:hypothetical protein
LVPKSKKASWRLALSTWTALIYHNYYTPKVTICQGNSSVLREIPQWPSRRN